MMWYDHLEKMYAYLGHSACDIVSICSQKEYLYILCHARENQARTTKEKNKSSKILKCSLYKMFIAILRECVFECVCVCVYASRVCMYEFYKKA